MKALMVAGTHSGSGKTTISLALMVALRRRGLAVQAFKVGPDFIDPGHHALATGRACHNLDGWMLSRQENQAIFKRYTADADIAVVEGVMGLYDGFSPKHEAGSSAQMAKWLGLPVLLAVDASSMARSLAAIAQGFRDFDPELSWAGLVANRIGSPRHGEILAEAMEQIEGLALAGALLKDPGLNMPERHLGLITAEEGGLGREALDALADWLEQGLDLDRLLDGLPDIPADPAHEVSSSSLQRPRVRIGVARDQAFCFYYQENLRRLQEAGAELAFFSPLEGSTLPAGLNGLYLGGGYPELFAEQLAANSSLLDEVARLAQDGLPIYAECGGMMYLGQGLVDLDGKQWPMAGVLPFATRMLPRLRSLGYRQASFTRSAILGPAGSLAKGHEFHYSEIIEPASGKGLRDDIYQVEGRLGPDLNCKGFTFKNVLASYVHLHFGSNPDLAPGLVGFCAVQK